MNFDQVKAILTGNVKKGILPESKELVRRIGADSMVLLKNDGTLPIKRSTVALFGVGAIDTIFCGNKYSYVTGQEKINIVEGLKAGGFTFSSGAWLKKMERAITEARAEKSDIDILDWFFSGNKKTAEELPISEADLAESRVGCDTAIYVIRRAVCEDGDRTYEKGDYLLADIEEENIAKLCESFEKVVVILNSSMLDISSLARNKKISAIVYMGIPGMEAGHCLFDVITGVTNPSGRLTDTWAKKYKDYPACGTFLRRNSLNGRVDYREGVFIGYRYFDTFDVSPLYPFGYGLSYTTFDMKLEYFEANWFNTILRVRVTNTGDCPGREVVQVYVTAPSGHLEKPYQELKGFAKTGKLRPGESEEVVIKIKTNQLASFSEKRSAYIMERGGYIFRIGRNSRDTEPVAKLVLDKLTVIRNVAPVVAQEYEMDFLVPPEREHEEIGFVKVASLSADDYNSLNGKLALQKESYTYVPEGSNYVSYVNANKYSIPFRTKEIIEYVKPCSHANFFDVIRGDHTMEEFISSLPAEVLARIVVGTMDESKSESESRVGFNLKIKNKYKLAGRTTSQYAKTLGIPGLAMTDGPSGIHIPGIACNCYPSSTAMAQTWDISAMEEIGRAYGREMEKHKIDIALAPSMNIHRDPMAGRSNEFYSEDPLISGMMAAAFTNGVQTYPGRCVALKHLAVYNMEKDRHEIDINVSRRTLREIYLKAFEICIESSEPMAIMNSSNKINGDYASSKRGLNTDILRNEWGFKGFVMSEWGTESDKAYDIHAGCDLIMPGYDPEKILEAMRNEAPTFEPDGYVKRVEKASFFRRPMIRYEAWGSFLLEQEGKEIAMTSVAPNIELNPVVYELEEKGLCSIAVEPSGTKVIRYKGVNRGAYLSLGDLQQAAMHILNTVAVTGAMKELTEQIK